MGIDIKEKNSMDYLMAGVYFGGPMERCTVENFLMVNIMVLVPIVGRLEKSIMENFLKERSKAWEQDSTKKEIYTLGNGVKEGIKERELFIGRYLKQNSKETFLKIKFMEKVL